jgi:hypothetical protein
MQCMVMYATGMYLYLSKISSDIYIFNFVHLLSGHFTYMIKDVRIYDYF